MQQIDIYLKGEKDYALIEGGTGPLVYPGLHVYIYRLLYTLTDHGKNIFVAQVIFMALYLATLAIVMACYRQAKAPPYIYPLLILSKRLHSIYILRLFNDCFTVLFLYLAIFLYQRHSWNLGTTVYSCGLGVKMNLLLIAPGLAFILLQALGFDRSFTQALIVSQSQGLFAYEFVRVNWRSYVGRAFQLNRQFLYRWTVNWRFIPEHIFLSAPFSGTLLSAHATLLLLFAATRWTQPSRRDLRATIALFFSSRPADEDARDEIADRVDARFIMTTILTANAIGMLCARSLHYQFYSWLAWSTPFLLWRAGLHPVLIYAVWGAQEWAWNVYPSTDVSSAVVVGCLAVTVGGVWWGTRERVESGKVEKKE
jgi:alpha-1,3-mannosyltransferase